MADKEKNNELEKSILMLASEFLGKKKEINEEEFEDFFEFLTVDANVDCDLEELIEICIKNGIIAVMEEELEEEIDDKNIPLGDSVGMNLRSLPKCNYLSLEEEQYLAEKKDNGCKKARQTLIDENARYVIKIAKRYRGRGVLFEDLIQSGNIGLIKAVDKYKASMGCKVLTYANWWIRHEVIRAIQDTARMIRFPVGVEELITKIDKIEKQYNMKYGIEPTNEELAAILDEPVTKIDNARNSKKTLNVGSLNVTLDDEQEVEMGDIVSRSRDDGEQPEPMDIVFNDQLAEAMDAVLRTLTAREEKVIRLRHLSKNLELTLSQIGRDLNVSRQRVEQIERKAMKKLRHPSRLKYLQHFLDEIK